ncbi:alpha/beta fold hydrolase [Paenibacillus sp. HGH0039]|uniref:alpha/beta fold hydrolase n=1 Tax=Paenibacillus sp. HGH0039 TaxID=1078505 RepID=UPI00020D7600|nr:hypothetical protein HMPREF9413_5223 [Paenibacillus sp. HGF7]EPD88298.1 hypothetical protein HMPREF1207_02472 [Paenibacillus sp. HGH0039]
MSERMIRVKDMELCTESFGNPAHPAVLLIMGATASMLWWEEDFCRLLAEKGFLVIRYDNRDTGRSVSYEPGQPGYTFEDMADDAIAVLDAYEVEKAHFAGMSMGGMLIQIIALRHPHRVQGISLLSTMYFGPGWEELPPMEAKVELSSIPWERWTGPIRKRSFGTPLTNGASLPGPSICLTRKG